MMIIDSKLYREEIENLSLYELIEEKNKILKYINDYETNNIPEKELYVKPSPQTRYKAYKGFLREIEELIFLKQENNDGVEFLKIINKVLDSLYNDSITKQESKILTFNIDENEAYKVLNELYDYISVNKLFNKDYEQDYEMIKYKPIWLLEYDEAMIYLMNIQKNEVDKHGYVYQMVKEGIILRILLRIKEFLSKEKSGKYVLEIEHTPSFSAYGTSEQIESNKPHHWLKKYELTNGQIMDLCGIIIKIIEISDSYIKIFIPSGQYIYGKNYNGIENVLITINTNETIYFESPIAYDISPAKWKITYKSNYLKKGNIINEVENKASEIKILTDDPIIIQSCKDLYCALMITGIYEKNSVEEINNLLKNDLYKTVELLKKFKYINSSNFNNQLNYFVDTNNQENLVFLIELLKKSLFGDTTDINEENLLNKSEIRDLSKKVNKLQEEIINDINKKVKDLNISSDKKTEQSCKKIYQALLFVCLFEQPIITDILKLLNDKEKTIELFNKFNYINETQFDNYFDKISAEELERLDYFLSVIKYSLISNTSMVTENKKIDKLTQKLSEAIKNNNQELIKELQEQIQKETDKQMEKDSEKYVKEQLKMENQYIKKNINKEKIKHQQKVIDEINERIEKYLVKTMDMTTLEFKELKKELDVAISRMNCYKNAIYDEEQINKIYIENKTLENEILNNPFENRTEENELLKVDEIEILDFETEKSVEKNNESKDTKKVTSETLLNFMNSFFGEKQMIELRDNKRDFIYKVSKNNEYGSIIIEKNFKLTNEFNSLFNELKEYSDSITDTSIYYPNPNIESPDLMILWQIYTKINEETKKSGVLRYPENWNNIVEKIINEIISR